MGATIILLAILTVVMTTIILLWRRNFQYWEKRGIPHDRPHPWYGNTKVFLSTKPVQDFYKPVYKKYKGTGPFCGFYFIQRPTAFVLDPQLAKNILIKDFANFTDRGIFHNERDDPLTGHLFALDGNKWRQLRHKLSSTFTSGKMKFMFPTVVKVGGEFVDVFDKMLDDHKRTSTETAVVEIKELLARFTTDVIGTCAFGIECNSLKDPKAEFRVMGRKSTLARRHGPILTGLTFSFPQLARKLRMRMFPDDVHQFFMRIVRDTVKLREENHIKRNDFMDLLVELKNNVASKGVENSNNNDDDIFKSLSVEQIAAQAFVFFAAGFETSSTAMGFALYELSRNQEIQDILRKQINDVLAKHNGVFTYECMAEMPYLRQVINETLRLHTIVPHLLRRPLKDYAVPDNPKYVLEKGVNVHIPSSMFHLDPEYYPEPMEFQPERFTPEEVAKRDSVLWLPFGDGPRNCIGLRFAFMQSSIGLILLLKHFKFGLNDNKPLEYDPKSFLIAAKGGINLRVEKV